MPRPPSLRSVVEKLREAARIALDDFAGGLDGIVREPVPNAKKALRKFPGIGEPGAEKVLLFRGRHPTLGPESNALGVLGRLGVPLRPLPVQDRLRVRRLEALGQSVHFIGSTALVRSNRLLGRPSFTQP